MRLSVLESPGLTPPYYRVELQQSHPRYNDISSKCFSFADIALCQIERPSRDRMFAKSFEKASERNTYSKEVGAQRNGFGIVTEFKLLHDSCLRRRYRPRKGLIVLSSGLLLFAPW
jgi:hypothetical protein